MYTCLKDEIPNFTNSERASRAHILKKTIDQIETQKEEVQELDSEVKRIKEQNEKLLQEIQEQEATLRKVNSSDK